VGARTNLTAITAGTLYYNGNAEGLNLEWLAQDRRMANPDALIYNEYQRTRRVTTGVSGTTRLDGDQEVGYALYYRNTAWRESVPSSIDHRTYNTPGLMVHYRLNRGEGDVKNHLTVGSDVDWQKIDEHRLPNLGHAREGTELQSNQIIRQRGVGVYVLDQVDLGPRWGVMAGLRTDRIHNELEDLLKAGGVDLSGRADFSKTTGRVGVSYNPRSDVGVYASWGQGFLPPATEELANNPDALGGFNTHLVPATSHGEELGVRGAAPHGVSYDIGFFRLDTKNDFGRYRVASRPLETFYGNLGTSRRYGLETSIGYYPTSQLAVQLAYTFNDFVYTDIVSLFGSFTDKVMPNAPRHQVGFDAAYRLNGRWIVGVNVFAQSMQYVDQANDLTADGYGLLNPRVTYRFTAGGHPGEVQLSASNLTGTRYIAFTEPDPDGNSFQPGPTREVFLGVRLWLGR
jgi:iron complex outermembrane receptor protein